MEHDIAIGPVGIPNVAALQKKPPHLLVLTKSKGQPDLFISLDKPVFENDFVQVKGFFVGGSSTETSVSSKYVEHMSSVDKDSVVEMFFPNHRIVSIKNLIFKQK